MKLLGLASMPASAPSYGDLFGLEFKRRINYDQLLNKQRNLVIGRENYNLSSQLKY
ncbi:MAG: hypothetical protein NDF54_01015 [archaeon GB-1867-035]|nr:hypothetical protein [Candidatus Culexmicrobium profundum]